MDDKKRLGQLEELMAEMIRRQDQTNEILQNLSQTVGGLAGTLSSLAETVDHLAQNTVSRQGFDNFTNAILSYFERIEAR